MIVKVCRTSACDLRVGCSQQVLTPGALGLVSLASKLDASLEQVKKEHDKLLKELGHEEAAHGHHLPDHDHGSATPHVPK